MNQFGLTPKAVLRQSFQAVEKGLQLAILLGGGFLEGSRFSCELHIDCFARSLVGPLEVRPMSFGGVVLAGAASFAALHNPFEQGPLQKYPSRWNSRRAI